MERVGHEFRCQARPRCSDLALIPSVLSTCSGSVPSDAWLMRAKGNAAPSLILDLTLRLRGARCLEQALRHADRIAQLLGDTTGVDSVDCAGNHALAQTGIQPQAFRVLLSLHVPCMLDACQHICPAALTRPTLEPLRGQSLASVMGRESTVCSS